MDANGNIREPWSGRRGSSGICHSASNIFFDKILSGLEPCYSCIAVPSGSCGVDWRDLAECVLDKINLAKRAQATSSAIDEGIGCNSEIALVHRNSSESAPLATVDTVAKGADSMSVNCVTRSSGGIEIAIAATPTTVYHPSCWRWQQQPHITLHYYDEAARRSKQRHWTMEAPFFVDREWLPEFRVNYFIVAWKLLLVAAVEPVCSSNSVAQCDSPLDQRYSKRWLSADEDKFLHVTIATAPGVQPALSNDVLLALHQSRTDLTLFKFSSFESSSYSVNQSILADHTHSIVDGKSSHLEGVDDAEQESRTAKLCQLPSDTIRASTRFPGKLLEAAELRLPNRPGFVFECFIYRLSEEIRIGGNFEFRDWRVSPN